MVHLGNDWDEILAGEFEQDYYKRIRYWLKKEYAEQTIYPAAENIFNALRYTPYSKVKAVILGQVNEAIARAQETHPGLKARCYLAEGEEKCWTGDTIRARRYFPAWVTEEDSELVQAALKGLKDAGIEAPLSHFSFCTNGSSFCGEAGIPTIGYGPSLESLAHVRDEYIEIDQLLKSCKGFESILTQLTHESA